MFRRQIMREPFYIFVELGETGVGLVSNVMKIDGIQDALFNDDIFDALQLKTEQKFSLLMPNFALDSPLTLSTLILDLHLQL